MHNVASKICKTVEFLLLTPYIVASKTATVKFLLLTPLQGGDDSNAIVARRIAATRSSWLLLHFHFKNAYSVTFSFQEHISVKYERKFHARWAHGTKARESERSACAWPATVEPCTAAAAEFAD